MIWRSETLAEAGVVRDEVTNAEEQQLRMFLVWRSRKL
jgi:phosphate starvation-inducible protein PhoH